MEIDLTHEIQRIYASIVRSRADSLPATLTIDEWLAILEQFQGLCAYCQASPFTVLDHVIPQFARGGTTAENCVPACKRCNSRKRDYLVDASLSYWERIEQVRSVLQSNEPIAYIWQRTGKTVPSERTTLPLEQKDREAIASIREYYGLHSDADAIRMSIHELHRRVQRAKNVRKTNTSDDV